MKTASIGEPFQVNGCTVTFVPANHCPGAVMVIFERPHHAPVLHCGDCRYHADMFRSRPELQALKHRAILHLDTTYCSPEHQFPLQAEVVSAVVQLVCAAIQKKKDTNQRPPLLVFGSYTIGKERIYMEVRSSGIEESVVHRGSLHEDWYSSRAPTCTDTEQMQKTLDEDFSTVVTTFIRSSSA
jgi:hypothetical protein